MKKLIIAYRLEHARYAAQFILKLRDEQWKFVIGHNVLMGLQRGTEINIVEAPRYKPTSFENTQRQSMLDLCFSREYMIKRIRLP